MSLRLTLIGVMLLGISLSIGISTWLSTHDSERQIEEIFDAQMLQSAKMLELFYGAQPLEHRRNLIGHPLLLDIKQAKVETFHEDANAEQLAYEKKLAFQIWSANGDLLMRSVNSLTTPMTEFAIGYRVLTMDQRLWHVYTYYSKGNDVWIITGQRNDVRQELVDQIMGNSLIGPAFIFPLVALLMIFLSYWLFEPVQALARKLKQRSPADLTPIKMKLPSELVPVRDAMNGYIERIGDAMVRERKFSGDAAHELKTPLAIIKLHHQGLAQSSSEQEKQLHHAAIDKGIVQISHTIEQLLLLSRVDSLAALNVAPVDVETITNDVLSDLLPLIEHYDWQLQFAPQLKVLGDGFYLKLVLKNIIENACKYANEQGPITIHTWAEEAQGMAVIQVLDSGPGLEEAACRQIKERFFRVAGEHIAGSGLGLSICAQIVELHRGQLDIKPGQPHGLDVRVILPLG
ncbi:sensor histidine kinase N-terminal domain-containing protein [Shewanella avicenniae]|uniref:histidine kinase n=1 Tax=Shewanella avicenniae TaxID=2814294 RepID=A0ABX7QM98_9GAMM|nr:ATP-binding protein [Shewanella avicenniae]QSX32023.1 sensor histidine kinase N-terminal domain-containing protein [Shewanella avicenniae]